MNNSKLTRYKHIITEVGTAIEVVTPATTKEVDGVSVDVPAVTKEIPTTDAKVFPSVNQAKRYNRTKLGGVAKVVTRRPKNGVTHTQDNAYCKKEG